MDEVDIFDFELKVTMMFFFCFGAQENLVSCYNSLIKKLMLSIILNATITTFEN